LILLTAGQCLGADSPNIVMTFVDDWAWCGRPVRMEDRMPKPNPDYRPAVYQEAKEYDIRIKWGPFRGRRPLEADEK
jgi:hypothetical protein